MNILIKINKTLTVLTISAFVTFGVAHALESDTGNGFGLIDTIAFVFFPVGLLAGLIYSLRKPQEGSLVAISSVLVFTFLIIVPKSAYGIIPTLLFILTPAFINLLIILYEEKES